ncbi:phosphoglycerate kinase [Venenivibrio stagnispumantis]|uniref:Phosphoglycerate kinase n=1 Tax=Venenivibrio stagnispumantis TaxID=407998 RepID=A0AA46ACU7_9AQUI|nr:phosphoglycerate kinase [Venenivibrio stagnispumantis]MCW4572647.1 phosphoglycerate kinase [Venenivibrio stagnispumantis]SMP00735.1 phosphoglycerate kinase [Venenivibrio stagnispumantis]
MFNGFLTLKDVDVTGKRVFVRVDYNVPLDEYGNIEDDIRIRETIPTINYLLDKKAKIILASHLGRPKGKPNPKYSLLPVAKRLERLLNKEVKFLPDCVGSAVEEEVFNMKEGDIILLENLRFHPEEENNDPEFSKQLAKLAEIYVIDAFGTCHRKHASVYGVKDFIQPIVMGFLLERELEYFEKALLNPQRPVVAFLGGSKVSSKLGVIKYLIDKVDKIFIGGAMAFTFIKALGYNVGSSLVEEEMIEEAVSIIEKAKEKGVKFYLPVDFVCGQAISDQTAVIEVAWQEIPKGWMGLDIGHASIILIKEIIKDAQTIVWNGPMGVFEIDKFKMGTFSLAHAIAESPALSIAGGGDTDYAIHKAGVVDKISYISTGGGAFLELLEGKELPCLQAITKMEK